MEQIFGLPAHPLMLHAPVVLIPLTALGSILVAVWPWFRRTMGWLVVAIGAFAVAGAWLAQESGERLSEAVEEVVGDSDVLELHESLGKTMLLVALPMFALLVVYVVVEFVHRRERQPVPTGVAITLSVLLVAASVAASVQIYRVGHTGAESVWERQQLEFEADD